MASVFGWGFHIAGMVVAIVYLCNRRKRIVKNGTGLSVISIAFPFVLWFILIGFNMVD